MQGMTMAGTHPSSIDNTRQNSAHGMVGATRQPSGQHYTQYQQAQQAQQSQQPQQTQQSHLQPQFNQTSWNGVNALRRPSSDHAQMKSDRRSGVTYAPAASRMDSNYPVSTVEGRQQTARSSGQNQGQSLAGTSPINAITNMTHSENPGSHTAPMFAPVSVGEVASSPQWQFSHLSSRIDQLAKTQADMLAYLHVELTRRKEWEEQLLKELRQRREQASSIKPIHADMAGVAPPRDGRWNSVASGGFAGNAMEITGNGSYPGGNVGTIPTLQNGYAAWTQPQNSAQVPSNGNSQVFGGPVPSDPSKVASDATSFFPGQASQQLQSRDRPHMSMAGNLVNGYMQGSGQIQEQDGTALTSLPLQKPVDISQAMSQQVDPSQGGLASLPALPLYVEPETMSAPAVTEEAERTKRKRKAEGDANPERPSKKLEVDERGVVIMMSGNTKLKERPTKIQVSGMLVLLSAMALVAHPCLPAVSCPENIIWVDGHPRIRRCQRHAHISGRNGSS